MNDDNLGEHVSSRVRLLDWYAMTDRDRAVAVLFAWRHHKQPDADLKIRYVDSPDLRALSSEDASRHALHVTGGWHGLEERLDEDERDRLYHLGLEIEAAQHPGG